MAIRLFKKKSDMTISKAKIVVMQNKIGCFETEKVIAVKLINKSYSNYLQEEKNNTLEEIINNKGSGQCSNELNVDEIEATVQCVINYPNFMCEVGKIRKTQA